MAVRFTVRRLLVLIAIICVVMVCVKSQMPVPSPPTTVLLQKLDVTGELRLIASRQNIPIATGQMTDGPITNVAPARRRADVDIVSPAGTASETLSELHSAVLATFGKRGITFGEWDVGRAATGCRSFILNYHRGNIRGSLAVASIGSDDGRWKLLLFMDEGFE